MSFTKIKRTGESLIWYLDEDDIQSVAKKILKRELSFEELKKVQGDLDFAFKYWENVVENSVQIIKLESKKEE